MGGVDSGRWIRWSARTTTEEVRRIDVRFLRARGYLGRVEVQGRLSWTVGRESYGVIDFTIESAAMVLRYRVRSEDDVEWRSVKERILFDYMPCHEGGMSTWLLCPRCSRRVAVLYGLAERFLCRHCYRLPYASQGESHSDRMARKARKLRRRLGATDNLLKPIDVTPKGMHWKIFERFVAEEDIANCESWAGLGEAPGLLDEGFPV